MFSCIREEYVIALTFFTKFIETIVIAIIINYIVLVAINNNYYCYFDNYKA